MAIPPIPDVLLTPLQGPGFLSPFTPATASQSPTAVFSAAVNNAVATGAPVPSGLAAAVPRIDTTTLLDRAYFRDLVSGLAQSTASPNPLTLTPSFTTNLGIEGLLGRTGLPQALQQLDTRQSLSLYASALNLFSTVQTLGVDSTSSGPGLGALLDITA
ncbi:MAG: hypothetical protein GC151_12255 [Betaproteobacteria bacterium]|nr:hypothetical protein [Betaproteobacteria bacterium]